MAENTPRLPKFSKTNLIQGLFKDFQGQLLFSRTFKDPEFASIKFKYFQGRGTL